MNKLSEVGNEASQTLPELESPARRLFVKGMAGLGATFASASLACVAAPAQSQARKTAPPGNEAAPAQSLWGPFTPSSSAGRYLQLVYPPSTTAGELHLGVTYTLWIPDGIQTVRAVIVHQHGASIPAAQSGATSAYDLHWQALAKKWDCVLLGPSYHVLNDATDARPGGAELWFDPRRGSEKTFLKALDEFAAKSDHPEISTVPWCLWGHSGGGIWADVMTTLYPNRVAAVFLRSGSFLHRPDFPQPETPAAAYAVPVMGNAGVKEQGRGAWDNTLGRAREYRSKGGPAGFAPDPRTG